MTGNILLFFYKKKTKENKKYDKILPATSVCCGAVVRNECKDHFLRSTQCKRELCGIVREQLAKIYFLIYLFLFLSPQFSENCTYVILEEYNTNKRNVRAMFVNVFWKVFFIYSLKKKYYDVTQNKNYFCAFKNVFVFRLFVVFLF
jgi:hypothetical protein